MIRALRNRPTSRVRTCAFRQAPTAVGGITFTGTLADGSTFSGTVANPIGAGYSFLDGFGFINAQSAVAQPIP